MKRISIILASFAILMMAGCKQEVNPDNGNKGFLDVDVVFATAPSQGKDVIVNCYDQDVFGKALSSLNPTYTGKGTIDEENAETLSIRIEEVLYSHEFLSVVAWIDDNGNGSLDKGEFSGMYGNNSVGDVEEGVSKASNAAGKYNVSVSLKLTYGSSGKLQEGYVADYDGNAYKEVECGPLYMLGSNLRTTHFSDGTAIPCLEGGEFKATDQPAYVRPYSSDDETEIFGLLYNHFVVSCGKNPCPEGYHIPSHDELVKMEIYIAPAGTPEYVGSEGLTNSISYKGNAAGLGVKIKSDKYFFGGTNEAGLDMVPAGVYVDYLNKGYNTLHSDMICVLWTSTFESNSTARAVYRFYSANYDGVGYGTYTCTRGQSLRCVRENEKYVVTEPSKISTPVLSVSGTVVSWSPCTGAISYSVKVSGESVPEDKLTGTSFDVASFKEAKAEDASYTVEVQAIGDWKEWKDSDVASTQVVIPGTGAVPSAEYVTDADGNKYEVVTIGTQKWMKEHLRTTHFNDGTAIPSSSGSAFKELSTPAYVDPYENEEKVKNFGLLYNWWCCDPSTGKNPCPKGWHVPSDAEFIVLEKTLCPDAAAAIEEAAGHAAPGSVEWLGKAQGLGTMMKSSSYDFGGTEDSIFNALPTGTYGTSLTKDFSVSSGKICVLWTSSSSTLNESKADRRMLQDTQAGSGRSCTTKVSGHAIRCVKDSE